ncbi:hypothetical protein ACSBR1_028466 [Camellia fascicularis]
MANNGHEEKIMDDINTKSCEHTDPNVWKDNRNDEAKDVNPKEKDVGKEDNAPKEGGRDEYYNESDLQVWKNRYQRRDEEMKEIGKKLADLQSMVHFIMSNNVMQPPFSLQDTPVSAAKTNVQKRGQKAVPVVL